VAGDDSARSVRRTVHPKAKLQLTQACSLLPGQLSIKASRRHTTKNPSETEAMVEITFALTDEAWKLTFKTLKHVHVCDEDEALRALLESWIKVVKRYCDFHETDNCWWYNERASLSTLAGAAWAIKGGIALEEFSTAKRAEAFEAGVEGGGLRNGRCDLYIGCPSPAGPKTYAFEAKQCRQPTAEGRNPVLYLHRAMNSAWEDSGHLVKGEGETRYAATFVLPTLNLTEICPEGTDSGICAVKVRERIEHWIERTGDFCSPRNKETSYAYIFPDLGDARFSHRKRLFPGVVLVLEKRLKAYKRSRA
jgi:hypothetical protein